MYKYLIVLILTISALQAVTIGNWQNIRFSGRKIDGQVFMQNENTLGSINLNKLIYYNGSSMTEVDQTLINPIPKTFQAAFPVPDEGRNIGLRLQNGTSHMHLLPVKYEGTGLPSLNQINLVTADAANDQATNYLDIVNDYFTFSDTKFYTAIQNRGGGFPTSGGLGTQYYSYMSVIADPESDPADPTTIVWALNYMNVSLGGITPGLYKITGTGTDDLIRIGNIETTIVAGSNLLLMSCNISDLLADADFAAWYNPANPVIGFTSLTSRTTVIPFATTQTDTSPGARIFPKTLFFDPIPNQLPVLSNPVFQSEQDNVWFGVTYFDNDFNFPLTASVTLGVNQSYILYPQSFDYTLPVVYQTENIIESISEYDNANAVFSFSDNNINYSNTGLFFTHIRGLKSPMDVQCAVDGTDLIVGWSPVTLTLEGNPVTVSYYRIEFSSDPYFSSFAVLGTTTDAFFNIPLNQLADYKFYRIIAVK